VVVIDAGSGKKLAWEPKETSEGKGKRGRAKREHSTTLNERQGKQLAWNDPEMKSRREKRRGWCVFWEMEGRRGRGRMDEVVIDTGEAEQGKISPEGSSAAQRQWWCCAVPCSGCWNLDLREKDAGKALAVGRSALS
jgi:hypothetical protein